MLSSIKIRRAGNTVGPEQPNHGQKKLVTVISSKSTAMSGYLQKQVSKVQAKKVWNQIISQKAFSTKSTSTILFESNELLDTISCPPTPPPKKSQTLPNLVINTDREDSLIYRALPSLPSAVSSTSLKQQKKGGLTRAKTWVGTSIQKWLTAAEESEEKRKMAVLMDHSELDDEEEQSILYSCSLSPNESFQKMILHCRILQVTNLASSKNYEYTMNMRVTDNPTQTHTGMIKRVAKGISAAHPRAALSFNVQGRFQLECDLHIKPNSSANIVNRIKSFTSKTNLSNTAEGMNDQENDDQFIKGQLVLDSGDEPLSSFANKGIGRYSIQTSTDLALELTMAFWLEVNKDDIIEGSDEEEVSTPIDQDILRYCEAGDYLTFYVKGEFYPMWARYWVCYKNGQLVLKLNERGGDPVETLSLKHLTHVNVNPSDDIQEEIFLGKKYGMVLTFGKSTMYLFGDNCKSVRFWKCLLEQQGTSSSNTATLPSKFSF